ncbi:hypothetical protein ACWEP4_30695 [Streptomyces sp. NPDC004227]
MSAPTRTTSSTGVSPKGSSKAKTLLKRMVSVLAVAAALTAVTATTPASAAALGCQSTWAKLYTTQGGYWQARCSGGYNVSLYGSTFDAGGWSGAVYTESRGAIYFCDWDHLVLNGAHVYRIYLNETRPSRCN